MRIWTLGYPPAYEKAVRIPGNSKAPGGFAFRTREDAEDYARTHADAGRYAAWQMVINGSFEDCTTRNFMEAQFARHEWHQSDAKDGREQAVAYMPQCGVCNPDLVKLMPDPLDCDLLLSCAPFINPDTGEITE